MKLSQHPLSALLPPLPPAEFKALAADIKAHGVREKIVIYEGKILDGFHRYTAAKEAGVEPPVRAYRGNDPAAFVTSLNITRRHLTASQRVLFYTGLAKSKWAKKGGDRDSNAPKDGFEKTVKELAKEAKVGKKTVERAKKVIANGSHALNAAVRDGDISVTKASEIADLPKKEQEKALKGDKPAPDHPATVAWDKHEKLVNEFEEMQSNYEVLSDQAKTYDTMLKSDVAQEIMKLREEVRYLTGKRDALMNSLAECKKTVEFWRTAAKKLGWKAKS